MSREHTPLFLSECVITIYPASGNGAFTGTGAWWSGPARRISLGGQLEEVLLAASGDGYRTARHVDEEHQIDIASTWLLRKGDARDFALIRNQNYVVQLVWTQSDPVRGETPTWKSRTYYGVTSRTWRLESLGTNESLQSLNFRAQYTLDNTGQVGAASVSTAFVPLAPANGTEELAGFFREQATLPGTYYLGSYHWPTDMQLVRAQASAGAGQDIDTVLALEVNGSLTGQTITLPAGLAGTTATGSVDLGRQAVPAGQVVKWKLVSGPPDVERATYQGSITLAVTGGTAEVVGFFHEEVTLPGAYYLGTYRWAQDVLLGHAQAEAMASQSIDTVLALEVNGTLTGQTITLAAGAAGAIATGSVELANTLVPSGQAVRWQVLSGPPDVERAGWQGAITLAVSAS